MLIPGIPGLSALVVRQVKQESISLAPGFSQVATLQTVWTKTVETVALGS
jgi:hypothetical protein